MNYLRFGMSAVSTLLQRLEQRATAAEKLISVLKEELSGIERKASAGTVQTEVARLRQENDKLKKEIDDWKQKLVEAETRHGVKQYITASVKSTAAKSETPATENVSSKTETQKPAVVEAPKEAEASKKKEKKSEAKKAKPAAATSDKVAKPEEDETIDVGRLDLRVGRIVTAKKHPDADSLYVEDVDVGEGKTRTVVSGLVKFIPIEEMQNRMAILLCNLKPAKMRGVTSEAMVMCASTPEKVEILSPPEGAVPGDVIEVEGYIRRPDSVMNPKKKIWETVAPDLKVDENRVATYKGTTWSVKGKGQIVAPSLTNVQIK